MNDIEWRQLRIRGSAQKIDLFFEGMDGNLPVGWARDFDAEKRVKDAGLLKRARCYSCSERPGLRPTSVWLSRPDDETVVGGMIVGRKPPFRSLTETEKVLNEFFLNAVKPQILEAGVTCEIEPVREVLFEDGLSFEAFRQLQIFDEAAVKAAPLRSEDRRRWNDFVIAVHDTDCRIDAELFPKWFARHDWPGCAADELIRDFFDTLDALRQYDESRRPAWR